MHFKPMLASHADLTKINYPVYCSPKLDGVRAIVHGGIVYSRSLKPIPNEHVQSLFGTGSLEGYDGELIVGSPTDPHCFSNTTSGVMSKEGKPNVTFYIFDRLPNYPEDDWLIRFLIGFKTPIKNVEFTPQVFINNESSLLSLEQEYLSQGYEGLMIRDPHGLYKFGRSTVKEGYLLKLKRYKDSEAEVLDYSPLYSNTNEAKRNELGKLERSNLKEGMVEQPLLGTIKVKDLKTGVIFHIGSGFSEEQRRTFYNQPDLIIGKIIKYKYFSVGIKDLPRHPVFIGIRDEKDIS